MSKHITLVGTACLLAAIGCGGGAQTDKPVATTTSRGTTTSPSGDATDARGTSQVRLVSALPATKNLDLFSEHGVFFSAVPYKTVTPYKEMTDNAAKFSIRPAGTSSQPLADNHESMADGHRYTLVALPEEKGTGAQLKAFRDEVVPDPGKAKVRVINAVPNAGELDVVLAGHKDALFEDVDFGHEAGFKEIDPQSGTLEIRRDNGANKNAPKVTEAGRMQFEAGHAYTIVLAGANPQRVDVIKFVDEQTDGTSPSATTQTSGNYRNDSSTTGERMKDHGGMSNDPGRGTSAPSRSDRTQPPAGSNNASSTAKQPS